MRVSDASPQGVWVQSLRSPKEFEKDKSEMAQKLKKAEEERQKALTEAVKTMFFQIMGNVMLS